MPAWVATLVVGAATTLIQSLLLAYYFGKLTGRVDQHDKDIAAFDVRHAQDVLELDARFSGNAEDQRRQWTEINRHGENVAKIKGKIGMNGN